MCAVFLTMLMLTLCSVWQIYSRDSWTLTSLISSLSLLFFQTREEPFYMICLLWQPLQLCEACGSSHVELIVKQVAPLLFALRPCPIAREKPVQHLCTTMPSRTWLPTHYALHCQQAHSSPTCRCTPAMLRLWSNALLFCLKRSIDVFKGHMQKKNIFLKQPRWEKKVIKRIYNEK